MWQVAVTAAAVAGSSLFAAKHLFSSKPNQVESNSTHVPELCNDPTISPPHAPDNPAFQNVCQENEKEGVFWFSSSGSGTKSKKKRFLGKKVKKKIGGSGNGSGDQRKKVTVYVKKRRVCKGKHNDLSCSKDCSSFCKGLGLGVMCMMSSGKAEMRKLSTAIDETANLVHELKSEFLRRKSSHQQQPVNFDDAGMCEDSVQKLMTNQVNVDSCKFNKQPTDMKIHYMADSEYASSVLTEDHQPECVDMDQLEAELASEFKKLPWSDIDDSEDEQNIKQLSKVQTDKSVTQNSTSYQSDGVSPAELNNKLSKLLVKQQESQILELESELNLAYSKLQEKEAELRALKDCVKRLTEFSISTQSDEETEACGEKELCEEYDKTMGPGDATVGMKRAMHF